MAKYIIALLLTFYLYFPATNACSCISVGKDTSIAAKVKGALKSSDIVFTGKLIFRDTIKIIDSSWLKGMEQYLLKKDTARYRQFKKNPRIYENYYTRKYVRNDFRVDRAFKGKKTDTMSIVSKVSNCEYSFSIGEEYIVYGRKESWSSPDLKTDFEINSLFTDRCTRTTVMDNREIAELEKL